VVLLAASAFSTGFYPKNAFAEIKIGVIGPMKFYMGEQTWWGAEMAADEINQAGGIMVGTVNHKVTLVKRDSNEALSLTDAVSAMERLITVDKVNFVTGGYFTEPVMAMQEVAADYRTIYIGGGGSPEITARLARNFDRYKYYFRAIHPNATCFGRLTFILLEMTGKALKEQLGIMKPKVAMVLDKTKVADPIYDLGQGLIPKMGMELVGVWRTSPHAADYSAELTAIKNAGASAIVVFLSGPSANIFSKQWGELKIPAVPMGLNIEALKLRHWDETEGRCDGLMMNNTFGRVAVTDKTIPFYDKFVARYKEFPLTQAGTYNVIYILKNAIERAKTLDTEKVILELEQTDHTDVLGKTSFYPRNHQWPHDLVWSPTGGPAQHLGIQWQNGKLAVIWPNGGPALGDAGWKEVKFPGTVDLKLPLHVVEYWKGKKVE